jgi:hypothetical protein
MYAPVTLHYLHTRARARATHTHTHTHKRCGFIILKNVANLFYKKNLEFSPLADGRPRFEDKMWVC